MARRASGAACATEAAAIFGQQHLCHAEAGPGPRIGGVKRERGLELGDRLHEVDRAAALAEGLPTLEVGIVCGSVEGAARGTRRLGDGHAEMRGDRGGDGRGHLVLEREEVARLLVVLRVPHLVPGARVHQPGADADAGSLTLHRALEHMPDTELLADLAHGKLRALERERRRMGRDAQPGNAGDGTEYLLGQPVTEIILCRCRRSGW